MVYILHLDTPLFHARHYTGYSTNQRTLKERIQLHKAGRADCHFTRALHQLGISMTLARVFKGTKKYNREFERSLKNTKAIPRYCPICAGRERPYHPKKNAE